MNTVVNTAHKVPLYFNDSKNVDHSFDAHMDEHGHHFIDGAVTCSCTHGTHQVVNGYITFHSNETLNLMNMHVGNSTII